MTVVYRKHLFPLNEDERILFRYININKFESLLREKAMFFCWLPYIKKIEDELEGSLPEREEEFQKQSINGTKILNLQIELNNYTLINCWHINGSESYDMWEKYSKKGSGVAIYSNADRLSECFINTKEKVCFSKIKYIDYKKDTFYNKGSYPNFDYSLLKPIIFKNEKFKYENEYRIICDFIPNEEEKNNLLASFDRNKGRLISINVNSLIEKIILMPNADDKFISEIEELLLKYKFDFPIEKSKLEL
ncbi:MAG: DUF2971 domain-containing protein [Bacteroidia bacterium]